MSKDLALPDARHPSSRSRSPSAAAADKMRSCSTPRLPRVVPGRPSAASALGLSGVLAEISDERRANLRLAERPLALARDACELRAPVPPRRGRRSCNDGRRHERAPGGRRSSPWSDRGRYRAGPPRARARAGPPSNARNRRPSRARRGRCGPTGSTPRHPHQHHPARDGDQPLVVGAPGPRGSCRCCTAADRADTTPTGGDMGAHVWGPAYLRDHLLPNGRLVGWTPDWYAGFPAFQFYMVLPSLAIVMLDVGLTRVRGVQRACSPAAFAASPWRTASLAAALAALRHRGGVARGRARTASACLRRRVQDRRRSAASSRCRSARVAPRPVLAASRSPGRRCSRSPRCRSCSTARSTSTAATSRRRWRASSRSR